MAGDAPVPLELLILADFLQHNQVDKQLWSLCWDPASPTLANLMVTSLIGQAAAIEEGMIRLVNGSGSHEGRVEVFYDRRWGTVCDDGWDKKDGDVVCRMLGFRGAEEVYRMARFGQE
ncbi:scavenger receptor class a member 5 [Limosa lapponica baueri]|uniref:Scavenger receptor class a member 5 n=1 Tax=Limosa lapponica baueri TaxID=1758121 RepID=A0A2I0T3M7_LIMLA|nr:scavenger receptor class a member 5 [Limosa lapponica baueri]